MDKEDFFDMLVAFAESVARQDGTDDCFSWHMEHMDFSEEEKVEFSEMLGAKYESN